jgi:hypothetical protein
MDLPSAAEQRESRLMGREAAATYLDMTTRSLDRLVDRGIITPVRIAGLRRTWFDKLDLDALIDAAKPRKTSEAGEQPLSVGISERVDV